MTIQTTFAGTRIDTDRRPYPDTFVFCAETGEPVLRDRREDWPEDTVEEPPWDGDDEDEDEPKLAGKFFDVTIEVSQTYRFRVPAWNDNVAKEIAEDWQYDAKPADSMVLHTEAREQDIEIYEDDPHLPDDFDIYSSDRLADVWIDDPDDPEDTPDNTDSDEPESVDVPWAVLDAEGEQ